MGRGAVTPNPDPQQLGTILVTGAVGDDTSDFRVVAQFNNPLDDSVAFDVVNVIVTCYDRNGDLKSTPQTQVSQFNFSTVDPRSCTFAVPEPDEAPITDAPSLLYIDADPPLLDTDGNVIQRCQAGILDVEIP